MKDWVFLIIGYLLIGSILAGCIFGYVKETGKRSWAKVADDGFFAFMIGFGWPLGIFWVIACIFVGIKRYITREATNPKGNV